MIYRVQPGQISSGEAIGILLIENFVPFIPGDTANATTYDFPVRFKRMEGVSVERIFRHDRELLKIVKQSALELKRDGVRAVTSDCGFLAMFQDELCEELGLPVFMSSLMQIPFISQIIGEKGRIGVITANQEALTAEVLSGAGIPALMQKRLDIRGLEDNTAFADAVIHEQGFIDSELMEEAVVQRGIELTEQHSDIKAILLECSLLPPYAAALQEAVGLPVFDFVTMINYVHSAVVRYPYTGYM